MSKQKATVEQSKFLHAINIALSCVKGNVSNPVFSSLRLMWGEGQLKVEACDSVSGVVVWMEGEIVGQGELYINPQTLSEYISTLPGGMIELDFEERGKLLIQSGKSRATMSTVELSEYPVMEMPRENGAIKIGVVEFLFAIKWASIAVATDESRPVLAGVLMRYREGLGMQIVGSDGYRLSLSSVRLDKGMEDILLVPYKPLASLLRNWGGESDILISYDKKGGRVWFIGSDRVFYIRLIQGDFPPFEKILPTGASVTVRLDKGDLAQAIKQVSLFARQSANIVQCEIQNKAIRFFTKEGVGGSAETSVDAIVEGDPLSVAFNYRYLMEYVKSAVGDEIVMACNGPLAPVQFSDNKSTTSLHIIMPVKI